MPGGLTPSTSTIHYTGATLSKRSTTLMSYRELEATTTLTLGLLAPSVIGMGEIVDAVGYVQQPSPAWTLTSSGELTNRNEIVFSIASTQARPTNVALFSDGVPLVGGVLEQGSSQPALPGQAKLVFKEGTLRLRPW